MQKEFLPPKAKWALLIIALLSLQGHYVVTLCIQEALVCLIKMLRMSHETATHKQGSVISENIILFAHLQSTIFNAVS
jgi:hypothetical protein